MLPPPPHPLAELVQINRIRKLESFFFKSFLMWIILKSSLNLLQYCFCFFYVLVFLSQGMGDLSLQPGIEPATLAWEGEALTTGPSGRSAS